VDAANMQADLNAPDDIALADRMNQGQARIKHELKKLIVGQDEVLQQVLYTLFVGGNSLIIGVPGLAKTLLIHTLARVVDLKFARIQFTPDLMPSDITGTDIIQEDPATGRRQMVFAPGPIFTNILLADEINRTPPKTQSALLEAMQEHRVTIQGRTYTLDEPFHVFATQNPIELEGTYPLPEAQLDRFMLKVRVGYPTRDEEKEVLLRMSGGQDIEVARLLEPKAILAARSAIAALYMDQKVVDYIVDLVRSTRDPASVGLVDLKPLIAFGGSPRASIALAQASRAHAFLRGRAYVVPEDVRALAPDVLRHRIVLTFEAEAEDVTSDDVVAKVLAALRVP